MNVNFFNLSASYTAHKNEIENSVKKILKITSKKFDKQILEFEIKDGVYETKQRVYSDEGKAPTLTSGSADKLVETKPKQIGKIKDGGQGNRIYSTDGKSSTLSAQ